METETRPHISVIDPIGQAFELVRRILFSPFDLERWFVIGFCAWLALLGKGGGGGGNWGRGLQGMNQAEAKAWFAANLWWIAPLGIAIVLIGLIIGIACLYLNSRGRFMFLHCVRYNVAEVRRPWHVYRKQANSLFVFRLIFGIVSFLSILIVIAGLLIVILPLSAINVKGVLLASLLLVPVFLLLALVIGLVALFTDDFVMPIMMLRDCSCTDAWREFLTLLSENKARFLLFCLFHLVIGMAIMTIVAAFGLLTCCIGFCLLSLPYIGAVILLPIAVFRRSYSLLYLRQYGPAYDVFYQPLPEQVIPSEPPQVPPVDNHTTNEVD
ncbi:hypothetical protein ACFL6U_21455 [Planctomycetota bacterium]